MTVLESIRVSSTSSSWCIDIWYKPRRSKYNILIGTAERLCLILGIMCY